MYCIYLFEVGGRLSIFFLYTVPSSAAIYTLSLHDALPICRSSLRWDWHSRRPARYRHYHVSLYHVSLWLPDRKSTRLNSSHVRISYAVFCLKKKLVSFITIIARCP